jgi:hypothetical protein
VVPSPFLTLGFNFDHCEIDPGTQHSFAFTRSRQDAFVLTAQCIGTRGPADAAHEELAFGVQIGQPLNATDADGNAWTFNPFVQITDVDRFGSLGLFHFWQPYAQAGFQGAGRGRLSPTLTVQLFPLNLGFDIGRFLTLTAGAGIFANYLMDETGCFSVLRLRSAQISRSFLCWVSKRRDQGAPRCEHRNRWAATAREAGGYNDGCPGHVAQMDRAVAS